MSTLTDNVGAIAGAIGAVAGIYGAIMGYLANKHANSIKALDLRLELRTRLSDAHALVVSLKALLDSANTSRMAVLSAVGLYNSGVKMAWDQAIYDDRLEIDRLAGTLRSEQHDFSKSTNEQLETELVAIHGKKRDLEVIEARYRAALTDDDTRRQEIRQQAAANGTSHATVMMGIGPR
jgi:hypothetical protein